MPDSNVRPFPESDERADQVARRRRFATRYSVNYSALQTRTNTDEQMLADDGFPCSFTKGLLHDEFGTLEDNADYDLLVKEINQQDATSFDNIRRGLSLDSLSLTARADNMPITWRGWESPRAGHYYDLQGPDADFVGMPAAPELGSDELNAEMAEVYALALLRDVPFASLSNDDAEDPQTEIRVGQVMDSLEELPWFAELDNSSLSLQEQRRQLARRIDHGAGFAVNSPQPADRFNRANAFRGSAPGAKTGPFVSQYMLIGNTRTPGDDSSEPIADSSIAYGAQVIDQKIESFPPARDCMLHWNEYLDVQNGANLGYANSRQSTRRFISTPRDLAAYVRFDALYQAYLNACLLMLPDRERFAFQQPATHPCTGAMGPGFPDRGEADSRQAFATFGGPHVLSLVTEVATRCLKAVRRQKYNFHRRARPERLGALLTLHGTNGAAGDNDVSGQLGSSTRTRLDSMASQLAPLLDLVAEHNDARKAALNNVPGDPDRYHLDLDSISDPAWFAATENRLLPMAFAEGSPMHPSYGAGHATVAGGCVTMLKAFFHTVDDTDGSAVPWPDLPVVQAAPDGQSLQRLGDVPGLTIAGELNKLAANISIARNMAGVHYYSDYYESLRMGERVATGILIEQMKQYNEPVEMDFHSFDGDRVHVLKIDYDYADPRVFITDAQGEPVAFDSWWQRHLTQGAEVLPFT